jgi:hypothetical protein
MPDGHPRVVQYIGRSDTGVGDTERLRETRKRLDVSDVEYATLR